LFWHQHILKHLLNRTLNQHYRLTRQKFSYLLSNALINLSMVYPPTPSGGNICFVLALHTGNVSLSVDTKETSAFACPPYIYLPQIKVCACNSIYLLNILLSYGDTSIYLIQPWFWKELLPVTILTRIVLNILSLPFVANYRMKMCMSCLIHLCL
jgi:hypothetical protein